jgi:hypothetical protein
MDDYELNKHIYMSTIKEYYYKLENTYGIINRVNVMIEMFHGFFSIPQFLAREARFREAVILKIEEIYKEIKELKPENGNKLCELLNNVKILLRNLKSRNDYISLDNYNKRIVIEI